MKKLAVLFMCAAMLASCDFKGGSKDLKAENDSLLMELTQRNAELDDMMGTFNEVQEGFRKINAAESRVDLQRGTITENSASAKQQIASDIEFISKQMEENKAQIAKLQAQLKNSNYNSAQMKKAVAALTAELNAKQQRIEELQTELASKNIRIQELDAAQLVRALEDVDMAVINGNYAIQGGLNAGKDALAVEDKDSEAIQTYANVLVVKEGNEKDEGILALAKALQSEEVKAFIEENYEGAVIAMF